MTGRRTIRRDRRGVTAIEYAIVLPLFLMLVFGIIESGRLMWYQVSLQRATAMAARCGALATTGCVTDAQIKTTAATHSSGIPLAASNFTVTRTACGVKVNASKQFKVALRLVAIPTLSLTAQSCHPLTTI